jgi:hypothetical protein
VETEESEKWRAADLHSLMFDPAKPEEVAILERLIETTIARDRALTALQVIGAEDGSGLRILLLRDGFVKDCTEQERLFAYYYARWDAKWRKAIAAAMPYIRGAILISRYKRKLLEDRRRQQALASWPREWIYW